MPFYEKSEIITKIFDHEKFKMSAFFISQNQSQKWTNFSTFYLILKGPPFQYHNDSFNPNFL